MAEETRKKLTVVVPFLNEEQNLPELYERVSAAMKDQPETWNLLLVDDGSTDGSVSWILNKRREDPRVNLLRLSRNFGHQIAITAGLDHADGDAVVVMDADLQDPPELIPEMLARWREGYHVVYAVRKSREGETLFKKLFAAMFYKFFCHVANIRMPMNAGDFRLLDRRVVAALREVRELHRFMRALTSWVGYNQCAVYYERAARHAGATKYPFWKSLRLAFDALTSFSGAPLRWVAELGMLVSILGVLWTLYIIVNKLLYPEHFAPGWTSLAAIVMVLSGLQLVCLGVVGQYVSRLFEESKKRPLYFLRDAEADGKKQP